MLIRRVALARGLSSADADDVTQDVLLRVSRAMPDFEYDSARGRFRGYLKTIVLNTIASRFRQTRPRPAVLLHDPADDDGHDDLWESEWRAHHVRRAMETLSMEFNDRDRLAFDMTARRGIAAAEVAASLESSVEQVYKARSRILARLREVIAEQVADEG